MCGASKLLDDVTSGRTASALADMLSLYFIYVASMEFQYKCPPFVGSEMNGQFTLQQAEQLLNFEAKLDVSLLDAVVHCFYNSLGEEVSA